MACGHHGGKVNFLCLVLVSAYFILILSFLPETYSSQDLFTFLLLFSLPGEMLSVGLDRAMSIRHSFYLIVADSQDSSVHTYSCWTGNKRSVLQMVMGNDMRADLAYGNLGRLPRGTI